MGSILTVLAIIQVILFSIVCGIAIVHPSAVTLICTVMTGVSMFFTIYMAKDA